MPQSRSIIPTFYLYGEPQRAVGEGFVHVESLDDRSRPSEWTIRPHMHRDLNHIILIERGGGLVRAEADLVEFDAPCLILIPAAVVHGFTWHRESSGWVCTIADSYLHHLTDRNADLAPLFTHARAVPLPQREARRVEAAIRSMARELGWSSVGQRAAIEASLLAIMVHAIRHAQLAEAAATAGGGKQATLVARLRERIEKRFRLRERVTEHARALGVSVTSLRVACAEIAGTSPAAMLDERTLLEARRMLLYSQLSVGEIANAVGFEDPSYFSRFFSHHVGQSPRAYRAARKVAPGG